MGMAEKIRIALIKRGNKSVARLSRELNTSPQNFNSKMKRDNFSEKELIEIAKVLECEYRGNFIMKDTNEII
jgi:lambda repressor-like predicted transcriptional regulator